jgi:hypothetical protein
MLSALVNGVKEDTGRKWYSLMDKVFAPKTLQLAWAKVRVRRGNQGETGASIWVRLCGRQGRRREGGARPELPLPPARNF